MADGLGWVLMGVIALLMVGELRRYGAARRDPSALPYPRRRLSRRLGIGLLLLSVAVLGNFWPHTSKWLQFAMLGWCCLAVMLALIMGVRDLSETSAAAMVYARRVEEEAAEELRRVFAARQAQAAQNSAPAREEAAVTPPADQERQPEENPPAAP